MIKQKYDKEKLRNNFTVRLNRAERKSIERTAEKYKFNNISDFIRSLSCYENDIQENNKIKVLSDISRTTNLLKAIYKQAQGDKKALELLEIIAGQLTDIKKLLGQK